MKDLYSSIHEIIEEIETPADRAHAKDAIDAIIGKRIEYVAETHAKPNAIEGLQEQHIVFMYEALQLDGVDISTDANKAFYEGALYAVRKIDKDIQDSIKDYVAQAAE